MKETVKKRSVALQDYSTREEIFNAVTHAIGALFGIGALLAMIILCVQQHNTIKTVSGVIYGGTIIVLYTMSTLYHALTIPKVKKVFRVIDHCSIYLLIAGTYTPMTLVSLGGVLGWVLFGVIWASALLGIVLNAVDLKRFQKFSMFLYISMGWCVIFAIKPMMLALTSAGMIWILLGGIMYMLGILFYKQKQKRFMHGIWHLFVLAGSVLHFVAILRYVIL